MARKPLRATPTRGMSIPLDEALRNGDANFAELYSSIIPGFTGTLAQLQSQYPAASNTRKLAYTSDASLQVSDGASWLGVGSSAKETPFGYNISALGDESYGVGDSPAQAKQWMFRGPRMDVVQGPVSEIRFLFANFGPQDTAGTAALTIGCTAEVGLDQATSLKYPLTFAGRLTTVIDPGGLIWSDPISPDVIAASVIFPRTYIVAAAVTTGFKSTFAVSDALGEGGEFSATTVTDKRNTGTIGSLHSFPAWGPIMAVGKLSGRPLPVLGMLGDSIMAGYGDDSGDAAFINTQFGRGGWAYKGVNARIPLVNVSRGGETSASNVLKYRGRTHIQYCDHVMTGYGVNDLAAAVSTIQGYWVSIWRSVRAMGTRVWQTTITPVSTSSDSWATVGNQTASANNTKRAQINNWLRDGAPLNATTLAAVATGTVGALRAGTNPHPLAGYIELADYVESARDSGLFKAAHTSDGTHLNALGATAGSAALNDLSRFGYVA